MALIGDVDSLALTDLVQVSALSRRDCAIHLVGVARGKLVFAAGELVHAEYGELEGNDAVYAVLAEPGITFAMEHGVPVHRRTVSYGWNELLLQATLRVDEGRVPRPQAQPTYGDTTARPRRRTSFFIGTALLALLGVGVVAVGLSPAALARLRGLVAPTRPAPAAPVAQPAAPPPAPEVMRVFFDRSSTYLHVSEHRLLTELANQLRQPGTRARIIGHGDGVLAADLKLARERADRVADFLVRAGALADAVEIDAAASGDARADRRSDGPSEGRVDVLLVRAR